METGEEFCRECGRVTSYVCENTGYVTCMECGLVGDHSFVGVGDCGQYDHKDAFDAFVRTAHQIEEREDFRRSSEDLGIIDLEPIKKHSASQSDNISEDQGRLGQEKGVGPAGNTSSKPLKVYQRRLKRAQGVRGDLARTEDLDTSATEERA